MNYVLSMPGTRIQDKLNSARQAMHRLETQMEQLAQLVINSLAVPRVSPEVKRNFVQLCWDVAGGHLTWIGATGRYVTNSVYASTCQTPAETPRNAS